AGTKLAMRATPPSPEDSTSKFPGMTDTVNKGATRSSAEPFRFKSCATCWNTPAVAEASTGVADCSDAPARPSPVTVPPGDPAAPEVERKEGRRLAPFGAGIEAEHAAGDSREAQRGRARDLRGGDGLAQAQAARTAGEQREPAVAVVTHHQVSEAVAEE